MTADQLIAEYELLEHTPTTFQSVVEMAALVAQVPMATINIITSTQQHQVAAVGFDASICRREDSMCAATVAVGHPIVVADASDDDRFRSNPFVTGELGAVRFYAAHPLVTPSGVAIGTLCVFDTEARALDDRQREALSTLADRIVDILELERRTRSLDDALRRMAVLRDELRRSNDHLSAFAGQVSHDLVGPLSTITMSLHLLEEELEEVEGASPLMRTSVETGLRGADRMNTLIRDILAFARVGGQLDVRPTDLDEVVRAAGAALGLAADDPRLVLAHLPTVRGDAVQLGALLQNLISNGLKFGGPEPRVEVSAERQDGVWRLEVADRGVGIAPEDAEKVFEPLVRVDDEVEGFGIGLSTCRRIAQSHGGTIGLEPRPGGGTVAWFTLPAADGA